MKWVRQRGGGVPHVTQVKSSGMTQPTGWQTQQVMAEHLG